MKTIKVKILKNHQPLTDKCNVAESFWTRLLGLIGRPEMPDGEGMLFPRCSSVHMWFMKCSIDIVFLKKESPTQWAVCSIYPSVRPWKPLPVSDLRADDVLELAAGTVARKDLKVGDQICIG